MINTKETIKQFGQMLRSSNPTHQARLRQSLVAHGDVEVRPTAMPAKQYFFLGAWSFVLIMLVVLTRPSTQPALYAPEPAPKPPIYAEDAAEKSAASAGLGSGDTAFGSIDVGNADSITTTGSFDLTQALRQAPGDEREIVDYAKEHGSMLDTSTVIGLMTTERDLSTNVASLLEGFGGHVSSISTQNGVETLTGLVPANSYFLLKSQLRDLVHGDRFFTEYLDATDLTPSAVTLDNKLDEVTASIDALNKQIADTKDEGKKAALQKQVTNLELQRENLHKSRSGLDSEVAYTSVSIFITEIPGFTKARTAQDFKALVAGFETPGVFQQMWINVLIGLSYLLQAFSYTFWLIIPLAIWLASRARTRRAWRALD